jgi:hypothetical protein
MKVETGYLEGMLYALISIIWEYCLRFEKLIENMIPQWFYEFIVGFLYFDLLFIPKQILSWLLYFVLQ